MSGHVKEVCPICSRVLKHGRGPAPNESVRSAKQPCEKCARHMISGGVPERILGALQRYRLYGIRPGSCTYAILCGDLYRAMANADADVAAAMRAIVVWIQTNLRPDAFGKEAIVHGYMNKGGLEGLGLLDEATG